MKLENQVCSLEYARKLKELGVKQESLFAWKRIPDEAGEDGWSVWYVDKQSWSLCDDCTCLSAFSVAELGQMLPIQVDHESSIIMLYERTRSDGWQIDYFNLSAIEFHITMTDNLQSNARAKMLIYLLENNFVTAEQINTAMGE